jgi:SAM-dependent methyltransferase
VHSLLSSFRRASGRADTAHDWSPPEVAVPVDALTYPGIIGRIHPEDSMLESRIPILIRHYRDVGLSALDNIEDCLLGASRTFADVGAVLDLPCGYGRVLRWLTTAVPRSTISACDIDASGVEFCAREFGAQPIISQENLRAVRFPGTYDLIWVGSLLTHLPPDACLDVLDTLCNLLEPRGVMVFTTHGESCLSQPSPSYGDVFLAAIDQVRAGVLAHGLHFVPYSDQARYGTTIHSRAYVEQLTSNQFSDRVTLVRYAARGWDRHQDVWGWQRH